jgi:glycosyltransferase involved in cell wall biosynthesis
LSWWDLFGRGATALERSGKLYANTLGKIETFFEEYFRKYADYSIVVTYLLKKKLLLFGLREQDIKVLRVGAKRNQFPSLDKKSARKILNLPEEAVIFCYAGAIFQRDLGLLIGALTALKLKCQTNPLTILIGQYNIHSDICRELNIKLIERLPELKDVYLYFNASDYGLLPFNISISNQARWPSKISDYMAADLPIIATPISDLEEIFSKYNIGILAASDSVDDFSQALLDSFNTSEEAYKNKIYGCQELMEKELDWEVIASETLRIYETVVKK